MLGPLFGAPFTFARGEHAPGTAPGQLSWQTLDTLYRYRQIRPGWPVYGVIGNPIAHSLSPLLHNTALGALNVDGVYLPFKVDGDPAEFVRAFAPLGICGLSVTLPHKEALGAVVSDIDPVAASVGAINTLSWKNGRWTAANTDAFAAAQALEDAMGPLKGKSVLILGAGGAARAVAFGVRERGSDWVRIGHGRARKRWRRRRTRV